MAYKCGVTDKELNEKKETYLQHADEDPTLKFEEFKVLYRDLSGRESDDEFMNAYVESIFRCGSKYFFFWNTSHNNTTH